MTHRHLRAWRELAQLTQEEVAERLGLGQGTFSKWERGTISITLAQLAALAALYGVDRPALLLDAPGAAPALDKARRAAALLAAMPEAMQDTWLQSGEYMLGAARQMQAEAPHLLRAAARPVRLAPTPRKPRGGLHEGPVRGKY
jgi:transcriptional regulator with XRE-family HTH domain